MTDLVGARIHITGIVQGVGFRPFVYSLADRFNLRGWVRNTSSGVDIQLDCTENQLRTLLSSLETETPPLARIDSIQVARSNPDGFTSFEIIHSQSIPGAFLPISPDVAICNDCLQELFDPQDHRYRYPFINCTNCGPRFTIIEDIPYDRPKTTMAPFVMCEYCLEQYENPLDRRFHAQPVACAKCGPQVWLEYKHIETNTTTYNNHQTKIFGDLAIQEAQNLLSHGKILAVKGLGGFHLACDASDSKAVAELRRRKFRVDKPFALMMANIETVERHCIVNHKERGLLKSRQRPIVLLNKTINSLIVPDVAPFQNTLGVMLPYTPLHYLLFSPSPNLKSPTNPPEALVMTSANLSEEPIAINNDEARVKLNSLADAFLMHNRDIRTRCDDSVISVVNLDIQRKNTNTREGLQDIYPIRRSRGYAPNAIHIPWKAPQILAAGSELKNTFCYTKEHYAFMSQHIGDMENFETFQSYEDSIAHFEKLFRLHPKIIAYDIHPDYLATRYALARAENEQLLTFGIQHHHAHIAACMVDNNINDNEPVIGISFDGTGFGEDGMIWGGEFFIANYNNYQRFAHLDYCPLPGGDSSTHKPFRMALAQLWAHNIPWEDDLCPVKACSDGEISTLRIMLEKHINTPLTSSMGRLFDAIAALTGVRMEVNYEAQAAIELEAISDTEEKRAYPLPLENGILDTGTLLEAVIHDVRSNMPASTISAKFHNGISEAVLDTCIAIRNQYDIQRVSLSGGVWQNLTLLRNTIPLLDGAGFEVLIHHQVPPNDGGLALGQAAIAIHKQF